VAGTTNGELAVMCLGPGYDGLDALDRRWLNVDCSAQAIETGVVVFYLGVSGVAGAHDPPPRPSLQLSAQSIEISAEATASILRLSLAWDSAERERKAGCLLEKHASGSFRHASLLFVGDNQIMHGRAACGNCGACCSGAF
jgi:hypothetical protein